MSKEKKSILIFVDWYEPGYRAGGPIRSISGFIDNLKSEFKIFLITRDRDLDQSAPYENIVVNKWIKIEKNISILYLPPNNILKNLKEKTRDKFFDWVYTNSFFSFHYSILPNILCLLNVIKTDNILIAPRGELKPSALAIKPKKKKKFLFAAKLLNLYNNNFWHATSEEELNYILSWKKDASIFLAPNLSKIPEVSTNLTEKKAGELRIIFLSRIISYKNLDYVITLLEDFKGDENILLDIYGPIEDLAYFQKCMLLAKRTSATVTYKGELKHYQVNSTFSKYHLFLFPSLGENYGHVIAESLMAGCPVLTSNRTPWNDLEENNAGWSYDLDENEKFKNVVQELYLMNSSKFSSKKQDVKEFAFKKINSLQTLSLYKDFFNTVKEPSGFLLKTN